MATSSTVASAGNKPVAVCCALTWLLMNIIVTHLQRHLLQTCGCVLNRYRCHWFLQAMYQLQRGAMFGEVAGHSDEKALLHATFLSAAPQTALPMVGPVLYLQSEEASAFQEMPALDVALQPGKPAITASTGPV